MSERRKTRTRRVRLVAALVAQVGLMTWTAACAKPKAHIVADGPVLEVPPPPPRDIEPNETEPLPPVPLPQEPARNTPVRSRPPAPPTREREAPRPEPAKPEPVIETESKPAEESAKPPITLQTTPAEAEGEVERGIRATLTRAATALSRIDYRVLNADARTQYDQAKRFIEQADDAVRGKNLVFAKSLADKAAGIAAQLGGR
ncbi:MAG TPA: hypothetical protein VH583_23970 [Vicinamibacterales bacterium]|jgi:hypothetical protein